MEQYLYFGSLGLHERQYQVPNFIGLALNPAPVSYTHLTLPTICSV